MAQGAKGAHGGRGDKGRAGVEVGEYPLCAMMGVAYVTLLTGSERCGRC